MINKQGLIFLTLTSLILVLSVYYVTMPNEILLTTNSVKVIEKEKIDAKDNYVISNSDVTTIEAMKSILEDERVGELSKLKNKLTNTELTIEEKNNIYEEIKNMNKIEAMEEDICKLIKDNFNYESFVKIKDDVIEITIGNSKHNTNTVVKIISVIEKKYPNMYISVSFKE